MAVNIPKLLMGIGAGLNPALAPSFLAAQGREQALEAQQEQQNRTRKIAVGKLLLTNWDRLTPEAQKEAGPKIQELLGIDPAGFKPPETEEELRTLSAGQTLGKVVGGEFQELASVPATQQTSRIERDRDAFLKLKGIQNRTPEQQREFQSLGKQVAKDQRIVGLTSADVGFTKSNITQLNKDVQTSQQSVAAIDSALQAVKETPEAVGFIGSARVRTADFLETVKQAGVPIPSDLAETIAPNEMIDTRGKLKLLTGTLVPIVTGDTSGRYSNFDMQMALEINTAVQNVTSARSAVVLLERLKTIMNNGSQNADIMLRTGKNLRQLVDEGFVVQRPDGNVYAPINKPFPQPTTQPEVDQLPAGTQFIWEGSLWTKD